VPKANPRRIPCAKKIKITHPFNENNEFDFACIKPYLKNKKCNKKIMVCLSPSIRRLSGVNAGFYLGLVIMVVSLGIGYNRLEIKDAKLRSKTPNQDKALRFYILYPA
jgi:hypothetical protein